MSEVKTYDLEDTGSAYQQYREMVEQKEYEGDWVRIEDYKKLEKELCEAIEHADDKIKLCLFLTERNNKLQDENATLKQMQEHLKWKDEVRKENAELREFKKEAMPILENLIYWDTCPDSYKEILRRIVKEQGE